VNPAGFWNGLIVDGSDPLLGALLHKMDPFPSAVGDGEADPDGLMMLLRQ